MILSLFIILLAKLQIEPCLGNIIELFPYLTPPKTTNNNDYFNQNQINHYESPDLRAQARLSLAEWGQYNIHEPNGPGTYAWGYDIEDPASGNVQFRSEERHRNGTVTGSYGYLQPNGNVHVIHYIADIWGYRTREENRRTKPLIQRGDFNDISSGIRGDPNSGQYNYYYIPY